MLLSLLQKNFLVIHLGSIFLMMLIPTLLAVAFLTLVERKILAATQRRVGPNFVGFVGLLQPFADAAKLTAKEVILPIAGNKLSFSYAPIALFSLSLSAFFSLPWGPNSIVSDLNLSILYVFAISSLSVYSIIIAGWSSNSRYALLGSLRATAQVISYEVSIGLILINVILVVGSFSLYDIVKFQEHIWLVIPLFPCSILFFISALAETNRPPFDLPEAEGELVAGYNVEYSSIGFALFFIGEYANIIFLSSLVVTLFLGGWLIPNTYIFELFVIFTIGVPLVSFSLAMLSHLDLELVAPLVFATKVTIITILFIWVRAAFPRYRYDQLMRIGWKIILPLSLGIVVLNSGLLFGISALP